MKSSKFRNSRDCLHTFPLVSAGDTTSLLNIENKVRVYCIEASERFPHRYHSIS